MVINESKWGHNITLAGLESIEELLEQYDCYKEKKNALLEMFNSTQYGMEETGIEIIEQLIFDQNDDVRDKALNILTTHFEYDSSFFYEQDELVKDDDPMHSEIIFK